MYLMYKCVHIYAQIPRRQVFLDPAGLAECLRLQAALARSRQVGRVCAGVGVGVCVCVEWQPSEPMRSCILYKYS